MTPASTSALVGQRDSFEGCCEALWSGLQQPEYLDALFGSLLVPINVQWRPVVWLVQVKRWPASPPELWGSLRSCWSVGSIFMPYEHRFSQRLQGLPPRPREGFVTAAPSFPVLCPASATASAPRKKAHHCPSTWQTLLCCWDRPDGTGSPH